MTFKDLSSSETTVVGAWVGSVADDSARRVEWLTSVRLERVAEGNWTALYRDPKDDRLWELYYPLGEMHGGGPPALRLLGREEAAESYGYQGGEH